MDWLRWDGWPTAGEWQAFWAFVTAGVALVAAVIALRQHRTSVENQLEQARPVIVVDLRFLGALYACVDVTNVGRTAARDITFEWSERPVALDEQSQRAIDRAMVDGSIPFLAPDRTISYFLNRYDDGERSEVVPRRYEVKSRYRSPAGDRVWSSESVLDIDQWSETMIIGDPYDSVTDQLKKLVAATSKQKDADETVARAADSLFVYLEAGPRVQMARQKKKNEREARMLAFKERMAKRSDAAAKADAPNPDAPNEH